MLNGGGTGPGRKLALKWMARRWRHSQVPVMTAADVRRSFVDFFVNQHGHQYWPSSPVKPSQDDPSLLFVNAGMNQFKPIFLGQLHEERYRNLRSLRRVVNSQKCIRVGGKHCDLDTVGRDLTHHTFFEMLGNWSFGDYFKPEACRMAWQMLTEQLRIDPARLLVTVFGGNPKLGLEADFESHEIWRSIGVPRDRILALGMDDNFWEMGPTGPCGICTEIHYLQREAPTSQLLLQHSTEIWNLVFIQYHRDANNQLHRLPQNFVDTGMGLERIVAVVQGVTGNNYATDLFTPYFERLAARCRWPPYSHRLDSEQDTAYRVVADHARMAAVAIADGVQPDDRGAGYLLRRVIRRAIDSVRTLDRIASTDVLDKDVLCLLADTTIEILGGAFPELETAAGNIIDTLNREIELYQTAVERHSAVQKLSRELGLDIGQDRHRNLEQISQRLAAIEDELQRPEQLDRLRRDLHRLQQLTAVEPSLVVRFGLSDPQIQRRLHSADIVVTELENAEHQQLERFIQTLQADAERQMIRGSSFVVIPLFQPDQPQLVLKVALDLYGAQPLAVVMAGPQILVQLSVPSAFQSKLFADQWFRAIVSMSQLAEDQVETIPTKRSQKLARFRIKSDSHLIVERLSRALADVARDHFEPVVINERH